MSEDYKNLLNELRDKLKEVVVLKGKELELLEKAGRIKRKYIIDIWSNKEFRNETLREQELYKRLEEDEEYQRLKKDLRDITTKKETLKIDTRIIEYQLKFLL